MSAYVNQNTWTPNSAWVSHAGKVNSVHKFSLEKQTKDRETIQKQCNYIRTDEWSKILIKKAMFTLSFKITRLRGYFYFKKNSFPQFKMNSFERTYYNRKLWLYGKVIANLVSDFLYIRLSWIWFAIFVDFLIKICWQYFTFFGQALILKITNILP